MKRLVVGLVLGLSACSEPAPSSSVPDAAVIPDASFEPCWPADTDQLTPRGTITIGTSSGDPYMPSTSFVPLGDELRFHYLPTDGFEITLSAQMTGLAPGNPSTTIAPDNPRTRFSATFVDRDTPLTEQALCGVTYGYKPSPLGGYELAASVWKIPRLCWRASDLVGQRVRLQAEIVDAQGGYASDVKVVTLTAAPGTPNEQGEPGCEAP